MEYYKLLDMAVELGYQLSMCGAETFRVEESIIRVLGTYGLTAEVFAIPNSLTVSIEGDDGVPITRLKRIGYHGNDLDGVERYSGLSRRICAEHPDPDTAMAWLQETSVRRITYRFPTYLFANFLGSMGFCVFYGGTIADGLVAGFCALLGATANRFMDSLQVNQFFRTIACAFLMALPAYCLSYFGVADNADAAIIGCLMLLVPGLLFTNAMRDMIFGDTNSGIIRLVQVFLSAAAIALGTATAWNCTEALLATPVLLDTISYPFPMMAISCAAGCLGFAMIFNIHGGPGLSLCALGGVLCWAVYAVAKGLGAGEPMACFWGCIFAAGYAEAMARIRKYPAISYLVVSIFPLLPGAGIYYTMSFAVQGDMSQFSDKCMDTVAVAASMAVGIMLVSTAVRLWTSFRIKHLGHRV